VLRLNVDGLLTTSWLYVFMLPTEPCSFGSDVGRGEGTLRGREEVIMDGKTRITWVLGPPRDARIAPLQRVGVGIGGCAEALRARLIAATVELAVEGSHPRLIKSRDAHRSA
jgi:hypothetical protein